MDGRARMRLLALSSLFFGSTTSSSFYSQLQPCPQPCSVTGFSPVNWTTYHSFDHISHCNQTVLFEFNVFNNITRPETHTSVQACINSANGTSEPATSQQAALACQSAAATSTSLQIIAWKATTSVTTTSASFSLAAEALQNYVDSAAACGNQTILFSSQEDVVIGLYVGSNIESDAATTALVSELSSHISTASPAEAFAAQVCGDKYDASRVLGLVVSTTGDYALVQSAVQTWANATCISEYESATATNITISQISQTAYSDNHTIYHGGSLDTRADTCSYVLVVSGDSCASLATECGISAAEFTNYNPTSDLCSTLVPGEPVCCSSGSLPDLSPQENSDGTCYSYTVQCGDYCDLLANEYYITVDDIEQYNAQTWGWMGCADLQLGAVMCLSAGDPPMPAAVSNTECGPQVPGTARPSDWSDIGSLNPCPLNACCDIWGECGITPDFCTATQSTTGAPGTAANGTNGCISNCGTDIVNNDEAPSQFMNIGYFEAFGVNRSCLVMEASQLPSAYSHVHFAFGGVTDDYQVDISSYQTQFESFAALTSFNRVLSFGGWSFSTSLDSYPIFRDGVTDANRLTFAESVASIVNEYNLDGVDFDWEYPDAPDIPGIPAGSPTDGPNYLSFLQTLRTLLPSNKTMSIAAPASYWYLKGFPISNMSEVLDYIVYMTYDLHGQWDYDNEFSNPGCPTGNCLRSHVNLTETEYALAMITKAGVPANKIVVGIASYGRSFGMEDPSCTGPECLFSGPDSTATPGECTDTAGYISQAELAQFTNSTASTLSRRAVTTWHDDSSDSDMMTYGNDTWVAYMSQDTKASRIALYAGYNFGGSVEWALDLTNFVESVSDAEASENITTLEEEFTEGLALSEYDISNFTTFNLSDLATRLIGWDGCKKEYALDPAEVFSGWQQSWKLMDFMYNTAFYDMDFNEAAAVEYLGPPALNQAQQNAFRDIYVNLDTIQPGYITLPLDWRLAVRCDDPSAKCQCSGKDPKTWPIAYTTQKDAKYGVARINFCPHYFLTPKLNDAMSWADKSLGAQSYADLRNYLPNQGHVWFHELLHVDWVAQARSYGSNQHITDIKMEVQIATGGTEIISAYGPQPCKALARWGVDTGSWVIRNSDSLSMYAMAKYVQKALGNIYPHLPLAPRPPERVPATASSDVEVTVTDLFTMLDNGTVELPANMTLDNSLEWDMSQGICAAPDDEDDDEDATDFATLGTDFAIQTDFPTDYLSSWSSWAGLAPTTSTTSSATPTATWTIAIYSEEDCSGDYYSLEGHNVDSTSDTCIVLQGGLSEDGTGSDVSCRWFTDGGESYTDCDASTLTQPLSWQVVGGVCTAYDTDTCSEDGYEDAYDPAEGCHNYSPDLQDTQNWVALRCGADVANGLLQQSNGTYLDGALSGNVSGTPSVTTSTALSASASSLYFTAVVATPTSGNA